VFGRWDGGGWSRCIPTCLIHEHLERSQGIFVVDAALHGSNFLVERSRSRFVWLLISSVISFLARSHRLTSLRHSIIFLRAPSSMCCCRRQRRGRVVPRPPLPPFSPTPPNAEAVARQSSSQFFQIPSSTAGPSPSTITARQVEHCRSCTLLALPPSQSTGSGEGNRSRWLPPPMSLLGTPPSAPCQRSRS